MEFDLQDLQNLKEKIIAEFSTENAQHFVSLLERIEEKSNKYKDKKSTLESLVIVMENKINTLQTELISCQKHAQQENEEKQRETDSKESIDSFSCQIGSLREELMLAQQEKNEIIRLLERKNTEAQNLNDEIIRLNEKNKTIWYSYTTSDEQLSEARAKILSNQINISSLQQEVDRFKKITQDRDQDLQALNDSFSEFRKSKSSYIVSLESQVVYSNDQVKELSSQLAFSKKSLSELQVAFSELKKNFQSQEMKSLQQEESFKGEISAQIRLVELYKEAINESKRKISELEDVQIKLQNSYSSKEESLQKEILSLKETNLKWEERMNAKTEELSQIQKYIDTDLLPSYLSISPAMEVGEKVIKSGKTFTEMYTDFLKIQQDFLKEKHEKERLKECLEQIISDVENNAPILQRQLEELQGVKNDLASYLVENDQLKRENESFKQLKEKLDEKIGDKERELKFKSQQIKDLSRQVQVLLAEIEGGDISSNAFINDSLDKDQEINKRLIDFKNISELQEKNQDLLRVIRELSDQLEHSSFIKNNQTENQNSGFNTATLQLQLQSALQQIEELKEIRKKQAEIVDSFLKKQHAGSEKGNENSLSSSPLFDHAVLSLKEEFDNYRKEKSEVVKELNEQLSALRKENSTFRIESYKISSQNDMMSERNKQLQQNIDYLKEESNKYQTRNSQLSGNLIELQQKLQNSIEELFVGKTELQKYLSKVSSLQIEIDLVRGNLSKTTAEKNELICERERLTSLFSSMQEMQTQHDKMQNDVKGKIFSQFEHAESELSSLRNKLMSEMEYTKSLLHNFERERCEFTKRIGEMNESKNAISKEALVYKTRNEELRIKIDDLTNQLNNTEKRISMILLRTNTSSSLSTVDLASPGNNNEDAGEEITIQKFKSTINRLHEELQLSKEHCNQFRALSLKNEQAFQETNCILNDYRAQMEKNLQEKESIIDSLTKDFSIAKQKIIQLDHEIFSAEEAKQQILRENEAALQKSLQYDQLQQAILEKEKLFLSQLEDMRESVKIEHSKYENELIAHANDVQLMATLKEQHAKTQALYSETKLDLEKLKISSSSNLRDLEVQKESIAASLKEVECKLSDVTRQNDILLNQLDTISQQKQSQRNHPLQPSGASDKTLNNQGEMEEVLKFLRREREILSCQNDILTQENKRLKGSLELLNNEITQLKCHIEETNADKQNNAKMSQEYNLLLEKVNDLNILKESNSSLRGECERYRMKNRELEIQIQQFRESLVPLQDDKRILTVQVDALKKETSLLEQDNMMWKERIEQLITRSDTIDVSVYNSLKEEFDSLQERSIKAIQQNDSILREKEELLNRHSALEQRTKKLAQLCQSLKTKLAEVEISSKSTLSTASTISIEQQQHESAIKELTEQLDQLKEKYCQLEKENMDKEAKIQKFIVVIQKTNQLKAAYTSLQQDLKTKEEEYQKKIVDLKKEHELHSSLLNAQWQAKLRKTSPISPSPSQSHPSPDSQSIELTKERKRSEYDPDKEKHDYSANIPSATNFGISESKKKKEEIEPLVACSKDEIPVNISTQISVEEDMQHTVNNYQHEVAGHAESYYENEREREHESEDDDDHEIDGEDEIYQENHQHLTDELSLEESENDQDMEEMQQDQHHQLTDADEEAENEEEFDNVETEDKEDIDEDEEIIDEEHEEEHHTGGHSASSSTFATTASKTYQTEEPSNHHVFIPEEESLEEGEEHPQIHQLPAKTSSLQQHVPKITIPLTKKIVKVPEFISTSIVSPVIATKPTLTATSLLRTSTQVQHHNQLQPQPQEHSQQRMIKTSAQRSVPVPPLTSSRGSTKGHGTGRGGGTTGSIGGGGARKKGGRGGGARWNQ